MEKYNGKELLEMGYRGDSVGVDIDPNKQYQFLEEVGMGGAYRLLPCFVALFQKPNSLAINARN